MHEDDTDPCNCKEIFALLSQYLDAELPSQTCEEIESHLADCPPCIEFLESLKGTVRLCREYAVEDAPSPMDDRAKEQLREAYRKMLSARHLESSS